MTKSIIPSREEMTMIVNAMPNGQALAVMCRFVDETQTQMEQIAGCTCINNKAGVSKVHAKRCARVLNLVRKGGPVSPADIQWAKKIIVHYRRQIIEMGLLSND